MIDWDVATSRRRRMSTLARLIPATLLSVAAGCGPAITETNAAPEVTIVLTAAGIHTITLTQ